MKSEHRYAAYLIGALVLLVLVEYLTPKPVDWSFTLERRDKSPYGTYVLDAVLEDVFPDQAVVRSQSSLFDLPTDEISDTNLLIIATEFSPDSLDAAALLQQVDQGGGALVAASFYRGYFADTLQLEVDIRLAPALQADTLPQQTFDQTYFTAYDSARTTVLARDGDAHPVLLRMRLGAGALILSSVPYRFTNYHLLKENGAGATSRMLSYLPVRDVHWTEYYQTGRREATTPLRYVLSEPALRWALYLTLGGLLLFMVLEAKRKQRAIPVVKPPANTTLEFVGTVSKLFLRTRDHKNIADKQVHYLLDELRTRYRLDTSTLDEAFADRLAHKSGRSKEEVQRLIATIRRVQQQETLSEEELVGLRREIEGFSLKAT
ncbi:MAG: DUF4350 domain-containing protein [Tunicatimonas sp.]